MSEHFRHDDRKETYAVTHKHVCPLGDGHVDGHRDVILRRVQLQVDGAREIGPTVPEECVPELAQRPRPLVREHVHASEAGMLCPDVAQPRDELRGGGETVFEVVRFLGGGVVDERVWVESVDEGGVLVDAHVFGAPLGEVGAVAGVVAAAEVDGDEAVEGAGEVGGKEGFGGAGLEEGKVAGDGGLDERGPRKVVEDGGGGEGAEEGEDAWAAKEAGRGQMGQIRGDMAYKRSKRTRGVESTSMHCASTWASWDCHQWMMSAPSASLGALAEERT